MWSINSIDQSGHRFIPFRARGPRTGRLYFLCFYFLGLGVVCVDPQDTYRTSKTLIWDTYNLVLEYSIIVARILPVPQKLLYSRECSRMSFRK